MGRETTESPSDDSGPIAALISRVLSKLPARPAAFCLRFTGVFVSRRMSLMAAVSAFWALFALPWILIAFISASSLISRLLGNDAVDLVKNAIFDGVNEFLTPEAAQEFAIPMLETLFSQSLAGLGIVGAVVALWSGSKAFLALMDAITFIEDTAAPAGYFARRGLALLLMVGTIMGIAVVAPVAIVGPHRLGEWLNLSSGMVWLLVIAVGLALAFALLIILYKAATIHFKHWDAYIPGAALATFATALAVVGLAVYVRRMFESNAFLGALVTPIATMTAAYVLCLIVLAGAVFNYIKAVRAKVDSTLPPLLVDAIDQVTNQSDGRSIDA